MPLKNLPRWNLSLVNLSSKQVIFFYKWNSSLLHLSSRVVYILQFFIFPKSHNNVSLSLSLSDTHTEYNVFLNPSSSSVSSVPHLPLSPQSFISLNASSLSLFYLLHHRVIPCLLLDGQWPLNGCDKQWHSIRKQGKLDLFYRTYLWNLLGFCCKYVLGSK